MISVKLFSHEEVLQEIANPQYKWVCYEPNCKPVNSMVDLITFFYSDEGPLGCNDEEMLFEDWLCDNERMQILIRESLG